MKNLFRRYMLRRKLRSISSHLEWIDHEYRALQATRAWLECQSTQTRYELLTLDIKARRA